MINAGDYETFDTLMVQHASSRGQGREIKGLSPCYFDNPLLT